MQASTTAPRSRAAAAARAATGGPGAATGKKNSASTTQPPQAPQPPLIRTASVGGGMAKSPARGSMQRQSESTSGPSQPALPKGLPEDQRPVYLALLDEVASVKDHPIITSSTLQSARSIFVDYVVDQWRRGFGLTSTSLTPEQAELVFADLGVTATPNDIRDLLFTMNQTPDVAFHNARVASGGGTAAMATSMSVNPAGSGAAPPLSSRVTPPPSNRNLGVTDSTRHQAGTPGAHSAAPSASSQAASAALQAQNDAALKISFRLFVELLTTTLGDCSYRTEMGVLWHHLDADGDNQLSLADVSQALRDLAAAECGAPAAHLQALQLTDQQLRDLVVELDVDDDGIVSKKDFLCATNSN